MSIGMGTAGKALPAARGWAAVVLFLLCLTCSYVDRQVISLLVEPMKADLGLSDMQIGLLQGFAFAICYAVMGLPIAWMLDRGDRVRIAAGCVLVWSMATAACSMAFNYASLLAGRAFTAVAEAGLPPAALSLISDIFPRERMPRATALFMLGPYLGTGIALILGGKLLVAFEASGGLALGASVVLAPWRAVLLCLSLPGLLLALLLYLFVRDPRRAGRAAGPAGPEPGGTVPPALRAQMRFFAPYFLGTVCAVLVMFAQTAWLPTFFIRVHDLGAGEAGARIGSLYLFAGIAGTLAAIALMQAKSAAGPVSRVLLTMVMATVGLGVTGVFVPLVASVPLSLTLFAASAFCCSIIVALVPVPLQVAGAPEIRARLIAANAFVIAVGGAGGGPFLVGLVTDRVLGDPAAVGLSLAVVSGGSALVAAVALAGAWRRATG